MIGLTFGDSPSLLGEEAITSQARARSSDTKLQHAYHQSDLD